MSIPPFAQAPLVEDPAVVAARPRLTLRPRRIRRVLGASIVALTVAHLATQSAKAFAGFDYLKGLVPLLDMDREANLPTAFSAFQLGAVSLLCALVFARARAAREPFAGRWRALAGIFLYLAIDEAAGIHELATIPTRELLKHRTGGVLDAAWIVPAGIAVAALGLWSLRFLRALDPETRRRSLFAGGLFLLGAVGVEAFGLAYGRAHGLTDPIYTLGFVPVEEALEMTGVWLFSGVLLDRLAAPGQDLHLRVRDGP
jgi:hypothetical protein